MSENKNKSTTVLLIVGILIVLLLPALINWLILQPRIINYVGTDVDWLMFWGSYLGAVISAGVAFIILFIQRTDNEKQNEQNRVENQCENNNNHTLQLNILKYQQQSHWLDNFRVVSLDYCHAFNMNDVVMISNIMWDNPMGAFDLLKSQYNKMIASEAKFLFYRKQDERTIKLVEDISKTHSAYKQILDDLQGLVLYFLGTLPANRYQRGFKAYLQSSNYAVSSKVTSFLAQSHPVGVINKAFFNALFLNLSKGAEIYETLVRNQIHEYIKQEQNNIDKLLTENL